MTTVQNGDYDITYDEIESPPTDDMRGLPGGDKTEDGWLKSVFKGSDGTTYVRAVKFEGQKTLTRWFTATIRWRHCECPVNIAGRLRSETERCKNAPVIMAHLKDAAHKVSYRVCTPCTIILTAFFDNEISTVTLSPLSPLP